MSDRIFSRIIVPRYPIVFQEREEAFLIPYKAFLIDDNAFGRPVFVDNHLIKMVNGLPKMLEISLFQSILLHRLHYWDNEVAYFGDKHFKFRIKGD